MLWNEHLRRVLHCDSFWFGLEAVHSDRLCKLELPFLHRLCVQDKRLEGCSSLRTTSSRSNRLVLLECNAGHDSGTVARMLASGKLLWLRGFLDIVWVFDVILCVDASDLSAEVWFPRVIQYRVMQLLQFVLLELK